VFGVVNHRGVTDGGVRGRALKCGQPGQKAILPSGTAVIRNRETNVRTAAAGNSRNLKAGDDGRTERETPGLNLRGMLASGVGKVVGTQLRERHGCWRVGRERIASAGI